MSISKILDPAEIRISKQDDVLSLIYQENRTDDLSVVQCFPESNPGLWISLRNSDGSEIGLIPDLGK